MRFMRIGIIAVVVVTAALAGGVMMGTADAGKTPRITRAPTAQQAHFVEYLLKSRVPMAKSDLFGATGSLNPHRRQAQSLATSASVARSS